MVLRLHGMEEVGVRFPVGPQTVFVKENVCGRLDEWVSHIYESRIFLVVYAEKLSIGGP